MSLGSGSTIPITKANLDFFLSSSRELGNSNLYILLLEHFDSDFICSRLHDSTVLDLLSDDLIGRISSDFSGVSRLVLEAIPVSVLSHILSHDLLKISSEDALFSYISSRICSDPEYSDLLQFVHFEYLSSDCIYRFLSTLPACIDRRLWESISRRFVPGAPKSFKAMECPLTKSKPLKGIISYLTRKHGGNIHDKGVVTITSKSVFSDNAEDSVRNVADVPSDSRFESEDEPGQWICWDFHKLRIRPTHYTITGGYLKSWVVESSLDGEAWTEIDRRTDNRDLNDLLRPASIDFKAGCRTASFAFANSSECCFIRLTQTGKSHTEQHYLSIRAFEFFGTLLE
jgi:hypothetical protein